MSDEAAKFNELLARGRELTPEQRLAGLQGLARSPHYPALLVSVRDHWEEFARSISAQKMATHDGALQHCAGSMHALEDLEGKLRAALRPLKQKSGRPD